MNDLYLTIVCCGLMTLCVAGAAVVRPIPALWLPDRVRAVRVGVVSVAVVIVANLLLHQPERVHSTGSPAQVADVVDLGALIAQGMGGPPPPKNPAPSADARELGRFLRNAMLTAPPEFICRNFRQGLTLLHDTVPDVPATEDEMMRSLLVFLHALELESGVAFRYTRDELIRVSLAFHHTCGLADHFPTVRRR